MLTEARFNEEHNIPDIGFVMYIETGSLPTGHKGFAVGCRLYLVSSGVWYYNSGTATVAAWTVETMP